MASVTTAVVVVLPPVSFTIELPTSVHHETAPTSYTADV